ncbi:MAG: hypothetical protein JW953_00590 [Anaerolineae bacterium]|nr:hypothetical protein [Anaerolineae bacterium]
MNKLVAYKCKSCGHLMNPKHFRCLNCNGREFEEAPTPEECKLVTYTDVWNLPWGIDERARFLGIVEFKNGLKAMGWVKAPEPKAGMKLKANWEPVRIIGGEAVYGLTLEPVKK